MESQQNKPVDITSLDNPLERLALIQETDHFLPVSTSELGRVLALNSFLPRPGGTGLFFNTVLRRQIAIKKARQSKLESDRHEAEELRFEVGDTDIEIEVQAIDFDPNAAVRSVAVEFVEYYRSARFTARNLKKLSYDLKEQYNPQTSVEKAFRLDHLGLVGLIRYMDLRNLVRDQAVKQGEINPLKTDYVIKPTPETLKYVKDRASQLNVGQIRHIVPRALEEQKSRNRYWYDRLIEGQSHLTAKPIIDRALKRYPMPKR